MAHIFITDFEDWELLKIETIKKVLEKSYLLVIENLYFYFFFSDSPGMPGSQIIYRLRTNPHSTPGGAGGLNPVDSYPDIQ